MISFYLGNQYFICSNIKLIKYHIWLASSYFFWIAIRTWKVVKMFAFHEIVFYSYKGTGFDNQETDKVYNYFICMHAVDLLIHDLAVLFYLIVRCNKDTFNHSSLIRLKTSSYESSCKPMKIQEVGHLTLDCLYLMKKICCCCCCIASVTSDCATP